MSTATTDTVIAEVAHEAGAAFRRILAAKEQWGSSELPWNVLTDRQRAVFVGLVQTIRNDLEGYALASGEDRTEEGPHMRLLVSIVGTMHSSLAATTAATAAPDDAPEGGTADPVAAADGEATPA